jgi:hypothetical protein
MGDPVSKRYTYFKKQQNNPSNAVVRPTGGFAKSIVAPKAAAHGTLVDERVHVFVDDQNLFYGITNDHYGPTFRIDFGRLLLQACRRGTGVTRSVGSAYIAGVIPDDDSFWQIAENQGF